MTEMKSFVAGALAIASVTAVLKDLLGNGLVAYCEAAGLGDITVSAMPPDRLTTGAEERNQLNLFLYRVAPHVSFAKPAGQGPSPSNSAFPGRALSLELSYLLTACGTEDLQAEMLLGCAIQLFHYTPVLSPERIRAALGSAPPRRAKQMLTPVNAALTKSGLADQVKQIKISAQFLDFDAMSKLWSAFQARYRPSVVYQVSAVVLDASSGRTEAA